MKKVTKTKLVRPVAEVRPVAQDCYDSMMFDVWPRAAAIVDFGIDSTAHYAALQRAVRGGTTVEQLDEALGNGKLLTALTAKYGAHVTFHTSWDAIGAND